MPLDDEDVKRFIESVQRKVKKPKRFQDDSLYHQRKPQTKEDYVGKRYGRLIAKYASHHNNRGDLMIQCVCDCGNGIIKPLTALRRNIAENQSCGCIGMTSALSRVLNGLATGVTTTLNPRKSIEADAYDFDPNLLQGDQPPLSQPQSKLQEPPEHGLELMMENMSLERDVPEDLTSYAQLRIRAKFFMHFGAFKKVTLKENYESVIAKRFEGIKANR